MLSTLQLVIALALSAAYVHDISNRGMQNNLDHTTFHICEMPQQWSHSDLFILGEYEYSGRWLHDKLIL